MLGRGGHVCLGTLGCQVFLAAERVLAVVDGVSQFLQHHIQRGVLGQFHHEHTGFHTNVARVWLTWRGEKHSGVLNQITQHYSSVTSPVIRVSTGVCHDIADITHTYVYVCSTFVAAFRDIKLV